MGMAKIRNQGWEGGGGKGLGCIIEGLSISNIIHVHIVPAAVYMHLILIICCFLPTFSTTKKQYYPFYCTSLTFVCEFFFFFRFILMHIHYLYL